MSIDSHSELVQSCYIASLKYAPGSAKEFKLLGDNLRRRGWIVTYLLSSGYSWLVDEWKDNVHFLTDSTTVQKMIVDTTTFPINVLADLRKLFQRYPPQFLCIYNRHPLEFIVARLARSIYPNGIRAVFLHEPFVPNKSAYGRFRAIYIGLAEKLLALTLRHSTCVIVPSAYAQHLFTLRYPNYPGQVYMAPLLLSDNPSPRSSPRRFISFVGNINQGRDLGDFLALINYAAAKGENLEFCVVTQSPVAERLQLLSDEARRTLTVISKPIISDEEIADITAQSLVIFLPHKQAAQSGNIPVAFREGTPVIARDIPGLSQHVHHQINGYLFPPEPTPEQLLEAVHFVRDNFPKPSLQAREDFQNLFAESNWERYYSWLLEESV